MNDVRSMKNDQPSVTKTVVIFTISYQGPSQKLLKLIVIKSRKYGGKNKLPKRKKNDRELKYSYK